MTEKFIPRVTRKRLVNYIRRNPGLTTCQITTLLRHKTETFYTRCAFNARLLDLEKRGLLLRVRSNSAVSDTATAWRHFALPQ